MFDKKHRHHINTGVRWIHVKAVGWLGFETVAVWAGETVEQFKQLLSLELESTVTVPAVALPLHNSVDIFDYVKNFDTIWLNA